VRLHSDVIGLSDVRAALDAEKKAGRVAASVTFKILTEHGSRTHARALEVQLSSWDRIPGDGRRRGNDGSYGAMTEEYAALYDEWGWLMSTLYALDPQAVWGSVKRPQYADVLDFDRQTGMTYSFALLPLLERGEDPFPWVHRSQVGRRGFGRSASQTWYGLTYAPRTAQWFRSFAHLESTSAQA
jgi:hypothetical protein